MESLMHDADGWSREIGVEYRFNSATTSDPTVGSPFNVYKSFRTSLDSE